MIKNWGIKAYYLRIINYIHCQNLLKEHFPVPSSNKGEKIVEINIKLCIK
tara:strand:- start:5732 stop:5881 length:150 start_codon:yes stop_codon:yes gene_type:complete